MDIQELRKCINADEAEITKLNASEQGLLAEIERLEAEIARIQKLIDYFDKVDDFSRETHDLDVAEAARSAFSRYCEERYPIEYKLWAAFDQLSELEDQIETLRLRVCDLEDKADEIEYGAETQQF